MDIHRKTIAIETDEGDVRILFSPAQPRGYSELSKAITGYQRMREQAVQLAKGDKALAGAFLIDGEMKAIKSLKAAIKAALLPNEYRKLEGFIDCIDITGMIEIAAAILRSYIDYYSHRLSDGLEE